MTRSGARIGRTGAPSIGDVARVAGVSSQTVSRVSTGSEAVRPETRAKVLRAMEELGYAPNRAARALRDGRYRAIGLLAYRFDRTGEALITDAVLRAAEAQDHSVTLLSVDDASTDGWEPAARRLQHQTVDGIIVIRNEGASNRPLALSSGMPIAVSDARSHGLYPCVVSDEDAGARAATSHLLSLGHRTVHHLGGPAGSEPARLRLAGWAGRLEEAGITPPAPIHGDWTPESGYLAGRRLAEDPEVTAVMCANDEMAIGLLRALREAGRDVPGDVSVTGFDGIALSEYVTPSLTTIRQDFTRIGTELVHLVLSQLGPSRLMPVPDVIVPSLLVVRGSTGPRR